MHTKYPLLSSARDRTYLPWIKAIRNGECATAISIPKRDQLYRVQQFIDERDIYAKHIPGWKNYQIITLDMDALAIEDSEDFFPYGKSVLMHQMIRIY